MTRNRPPRFQITPEQWAALAALLNFLAALLSHHWW